MSLLLSIDWKNNNYNSILVIIDHLIQIIYYKLVKIVIDALRLAEMIIIIVIQYHGFPNSIISNRRAIFIFKFWFLLYYFFNIKK